MYKFFYKKLISFIFIKLHKIAFVVVKQIFLRSYERPNNERPNNVRNIRRITYCVTKNSSVQISIVRRSSLVSILKSNMGLSNLCKPFLIRFQVSFFAKRKAIKMAFGTYIAKL